MLLGLMVWAHYCLSEDPGGQQTFGFKQEALCVEAEGEAHQQNASLERAGDKAPAPVE